MTTMRHMSASTPPTLQHVNESFRSARRLSRTGSSDQIVHELRNAFDPNSHAIQLWHQVLLVALVYEAFLLPFALAFFLPTQALEQTAQFQLFYVCELLFLVDFYVRFNTGFYENGNVLRDKHQVRMKYMSGGFVLDALAILPLALFPIHLSAHVARAWLECHKILRVWRLPSYFANLDDLYSKHFVFLKVLKLFAAVIFVSHVVACLRIYFAADPSEVDENPWLPPKVQGDNNTSSKYLMAMFWSFGLLSGIFQGELPQGIWDCIFAIGVCLAGFGLLAFVSATLFMLSKSESNQAIIADARITQLRHMLSYHRVPANIQDEAVEYVKRHYTDAESIDREVMRLLCPSIAKDIQIELLKGMVAKIPLFRGCDEQFIVALTSLLELISLPAHYTLFNAGDPGDAMYVVNSGALNILVNGVKVRELRKGSFFGEVSVFAQRPRSATIVTMSYCTLYKLSRFHIERVLEGYPHFAALISNAVDEIINQHASTNATLAGPRDEFMLTTLYQLSVDSTASRGTRPRRQSIMDAPKKKVKVRLGRSKSAVNVSTSRREQQVPPPPPPPKFVQQEQLDLSSSTERAIISPRKAATPQSTKAPAAGASSPAPLRRSVSMLPPGKRRHSIRAFWNRRARTPQEEAHVPNAIQGFYDKFARDNETRNEKHRWWHRLLLSKCIIPDSTFRFWWLALLHVNLMANWMIIPLQLAFPLFDRSTWYVVFVNAALDLVLFADMYVSANLAFTHEAELVTAPIKSCPRYFRSFAFVFDLLCALPYAIFTSNVHPSLPRVPRLLRVIIMRGHLRELSHHFQISKRVKLVAALALLMMVLHFGACMHFSITHLERYGSNATSTWLPSDDLDVQTLPANDTSGSGLMFVTADHVSISAKAVRRVALMQYLRSLYFAATMVTTLGKTIEPRDDRQYLLGVVFMAVGSLIFAVSIDNVQKRFTTSAFEQKEFLATRSRIEQFLRSQNAPVDVYQRVNAFLDFWWSSHCGTIIGEVLSELPDSIKRPVLKSICRPALQTLSLLHGVRPVLKHLEEAFVDNVRFILYGQGEIIYRQGDYASGLFFLLEGEVCIVPADGVPRRVIRGGFFGTASLHLSETSVSYAERMTATSGCILLFMSREHLDVMHQTFPMLSMALKSLEKRLGEPKMAKGSEIVLDDRALSTASPQHSVAPPSRLQVLVSNVLEYIEHLDFDPDVWTTIAWRCVVFGLMSIQCFKVIFDACFGVVATARSDAMTVLIELFFVMDMFFQLHVGYYRYGDKIMDRRLIRRRYLCSFDFAVDVCALAPLFALNWMLPVRLDVLNLNKLVRLLKVPQQFAMIEIQYLNRTLELRLAKLLFYASFLSHTYGCLWACMATLESLESIDSTPGARVWLPPVKLQNASTSLRYLASFYWSLGLMTASYDGELPKTPAQCAFSIIILISGFALLTYVIGNLLDVMELIDADNRDFNAKLNSLRHFLNHFRLPPSIEDKIKTYFFFKRFHTVTQEHVLERCLPPSLLTDIRLVHLQPMIMKVAFLAGMEASVTRMLVSQFVQVLIVKDHSVCRYGEEGNDMYFVFTGVLDILVPTATLRLSAANVDPFKVGGPAPASSASTSKTASMTNNLASTFVRMGSQQAAHLKKVNELTAGSYFGEVALFTTKPRSAQVRSRTSCVLYKLSKSSLEVVFERYPEWKKKVLRIVSIQQEQQRLRNAFMEEQQSATANMNGAKKLSQLDVLDLGHKSNDGSVSTAMGSRRKRSSRRMLRRVSSQAPSADAVADMRNRKRRSPLVEALVDGMNVQSGFHLAWLYLMALTTVYMAVLVPYRISLDHLTRLTPVPVLARTLELVCEMLFGLDIWVQSNIRDNSESMELYEQHAHVAYKRDRMLWDVLAAFPVDHFLSDFYASPWLRLNRCFKVLNLQHFFKEIHRSSVAYERHRLQTLWVLYAIIMFWCACAYFSLAKVGGDGSGWDQWAPPAELAIADAEDMPQTRVVALRVLRSCFLAVTMFVKRGKTFMPTHELDLVFGIAAAFVGVVAMAILLGEGAHLFISYIGNEVEFRKSHIAVDTFLERWRVSSSLRARAHAFLASHWSSHRGVNYQSILDETPPAIRTESVLYVAQLPLEAFIKDVFRPITKYGNAMDREIEMLMRTLAQHLKFEGYPRDENVIVEGSISQAMYFVVKGNLLATSAAHAALWSNARLGKGDYFGDKGLLGYSVSAFTVKTQRACDLLSLSSEALLQVILSRPIYQAALSIVVEAYRLVCMRLLTGTSVIEVTDVEWAEMLFHVLSKRKAQWNAHTQAAGPGAAPYQPHEAFKELQRPEHCCEAFYMMLKLIVAQSAVGSNSGRTMSIRSASAAQLDSLPLLNGTSAGLYNSAHNTSSQRSQVRGHGG